MGMVPRKGALRNANKKRRRRAPEEAPRSALRECGVEGLLGKHEEVRKGKRQEQHWEGGPEKHKEENK